MVAHEDRAVFVNDSYFKIEFLLNFRINLKLNSKFISTAISFENQFKFYFISVFYFKVISKAFMFYFLF